MKSPLPNYLTGKRGRQWGRSLLAAREAGAKIVVEATGEEVAYRRTTQAGFVARPWVALSDLRRHSHSVKVTCSRCRRFDSYDCVAVFT
jgi:hypothetical protein